MFAYRANLSFQISIFFPPIPLYSRLATSSRDQTYLFIIVYSAFQTSWKFNHVRCAIFYHTLDRLITFYTCFYEESPANHISRIFRHRALYSLIFPFIIVPAIVTRTSPISASHPLWRRIFHPTRWKINFARSATSRHGTMFIYRTIMRCLNGRGRRRALVIPSENVSTPRPGVYTREFVGGSGCMRDNVLVPGSINNLHKPVGKFTCYAEAAVGVAEGRRGRGWRRRRDVPRELESGLQVTAGRFMRPLHACKVLITRAGNFATRRISVSFGRQGRKKARTECFRYANAPSCCPTIPITALLTNAEIVHDDSRDLSLCVPFVRIYIYMYTRACPPYRRY